MRSRLSLVVAAFAIGGGLSGCTDSSNDGAEKTTSTQSVTVDADTTRTACSQFASMWTEQAQIATDRLGSPEPDPHGTAALEAAERAFDAAAEGSQDARRLGAEAETLYNSGDPADFNAKVSEFFRTVCESSPPKLDCEPMTLCEAQSLDSYG